MNGITLKEVLEKLQEAVEVEDWTIVQELLNTIEMELSEFRAGQPKPGVIYEPKVLRWLNMKDQAELRLINLQVYYRFKYTGELIPLRINSGGSFSAKFCFRKIQV